jgi:cell division protein FtsQ
VRTRAPRAVYTPTSKLKAVRTVGLTGPAAIAASILMAALIVAAALATGGRLDQAGEVARKASDQVVNLWTTGDALVRRAASEQLFQISAVHLQGASKNSQDEILRAAGVRPGGSLLDVDLDAIRARVERVGWVDRARVMRLFPDTLVIGVVERPLIAVWQHAGRREVVARNGGVVRGVDPNEFRGLPLLVGAGANEGAAALLPQVRERARLAARISALRRVDGRRWDLILKNGCVILLAASDESASLARLDGLDRQSKILDLPLARIDLRDPHFTVVRPHAAAPTVVSHGV